MERWVEITFDCLPLRSVARLDVPLDASPGYRALVERVNAAIEKHGAHNSYYLYNARCIYRLANHPEIGMIEFRFEGCLLTNETDEQARRCDFEVELVRETCDWLTTPVVQWFQETVQRSVAIEFDRYAAAGDLEQTRQRIAKLQAEAEASGGFLGMYL